MSATDITRPPAPTRASAGAPRPTPRPRASAAARAMVTELARHHADELLRHATRQASSPDDAHDAYQRTLELMLEHADEIDRRKALPWAYTVISREAQRLSRQRAATLPFDEEVDSRADLLPAATGNDPEQDAERIDITRRAQEVLAGLPEHQAQALCLRVQGLSYDEIGAALGRSNRQVRRAVHDGSRSFEHRYRALAAGLVCATAAGNIRGYLDGELSYRSRVQLRAHLSRCPGCRSAMHQQRSDTALLALLPPALASVAAEGGQRRGWVSEHLLGPLDQLLYRSGGAIEQLSTAKLGAVAASTVAIAGTGALTQDQLRDPATVANLPAVLTRAPAPTATAQQSEVAGVTDAVTSAIRRERALSRKAAASRRRTAARRKAAQVRRQRLAASREFTPAASEFTADTTSAAATQVSPGTRNSDSAPAAPPAAQAPLEVSAGGNTESSVDVVTEAAP